MLDFQYMGTVTDIPTQTSAQLDPGSTTFAGWFIRFCCHLLLGWLLIPGIGMIHAASLQLDELPKKSLGSRTEILMEEGSPLTLVQAQALYREGKFYPSRQAILNFGIGARPAWVRLNLNNPTHQALTMHLVAGATWTDRLDVFLVHSGIGKTVWQTGDEQPDIKGVAPALGYALPMSFEPGASELYLRVESIDPMVLPIELVSTDRFHENQRAMGYLYGFIYGFLLALCAYNLLLFAGLGERSYLYYSLYLLSCILGDIAFTGHGLAWFWPGEMQVQRYVILVQMALVACFGLLFACRFLKLSEHAPGALTLVRWFAGLGAGAMTLCLLAGSHLAAALVAFSFMGLFTVCMFAIGVLTVRHGRPTGRYFLLATACGMTGAATTVLAVWGWLPFTPMSYHAFELGVIIEATLLALALAHQIRQHQQSSRQAEQLARTDPLTGLYNRRAFLELAGPSWSTAERGNRQLSLIMIDIDHFKQINDRHGHEIGDRALVELAHQLAPKTRAGDILARWGGEEFILMLPETDLTQACVFAERMRHSIAAVRLPIKSGLLAFTASFGVAVRAMDMRLEDLIKAADVQLYEAKRQGRNRVSPRPAPLVATGKNVSGNLVKLVWHDKFESGHALIDDQHRTLFDEVNNLLAALLSARPEDEIATQIDKLVRDIVHHFQDEEAIIRAAGFPGADEHAAIHRKLVDRAVHLGSRFHAKDIDSGELFQFLAYELVARHLLGTDRDFFTYLAQQGAPAAKLAAPTEQPLQ
jgi:diguanylate cyclase (GGDEF)-like protein/hemerythrin-like metal-binding protein